MKISQTNLLNQLATEQLNRKDNKIDKNRQGKTGDDTALNFDDIFQAKINSGEAFSYNHQVTLNSAAVNQLMQEGEDIRNSVRDLVRDFLERQGVTLDQLKSGEIEELEVDEITQKRAQELIGPGGALSPENVSDRIVNFAIAGFGGDKSKIDIIRSAIDQGFSEAEHILGELADVSKQTYDLIQQKLDNWINEDQSKETETSQ